MPDLTLAPRAVGSKRVGRLAGWQQASWQVGRLAGWQQASWQQASWQVGRLAASELAGWQVGSKRARDRFISTARLRRIPNITFYLVRQRRGPSFALVTLGQT